MDLTKQQIGKIVELCLLAGEILLKSGAETSRIEDTMNRIAASFGIPDAQSFVMQSGIVFSSNREDPAKLIRVAERSTNLEKVAVVNSISRKISNGELTAEEALSELKRIADAKLPYSFWVKALAAASASGSFLIMFQGSWRDVIPAMIAGGMGYTIINSTNPTATADIAKIIIAAVMPLVPGLLITNAVRDLMDGHFVSALSKGADAFLTDLAIGTGIAFILTFAQRL